MPLGREAKNPLPIMVLALSRESLLICLVVKFCQKANQELADGQTTGRRTRRADSRQPAGQEFLLMPRSAFGKLGVLPPLPSEAPEEVTLAIDRELIADIRAIIDKFDEEIRPLIASGEYYFVCDEMKKLLSSLESISSCIPLFDNLRFCLHFVVIRLRSLQELMQKFCVKEDMDKHTQELLISVSLRGIDERIKELNQYFDTHSQAASTSAEPPSL
jgi:hypothetical protein